MTVGRLLPKQDLHATHQQTKEPQTRRGCLKTLAKRDPRDFRAKSPAVQKARIRIPMRTIRGLHPSRISRFRDTRAPFPAGAAESGALRSLCSLLVPLLNGQQEPLPPTALCGALHPKPNGKRNQFEISPQSRESGSSCFPGAKCVQTSAILSKR